MLIDTHAHSSGISKCCRASIDEVFKDAKAVGIEGIVLTNHYTEGYADNGDYLELAKRYIAEYRYAEECAKKAQMRIFFGIEVTMELEGFPHILIYGVHPDFILEHPAIFNYGQEKLYTVVKNAGGVVVQAHPFRKNTNLLFDLKYLDGIELNCHPLYEGTHFEELTKIALENNKILTCGGDYHADIYRVKCGYYFPNDIKDGIELGKYLLKAGSKKLCIQEVGSQTSYDYSYIVNKQQNSR